MIDKPIAFGFVIQIALGIILALAILGAFRLIVFLLMVIGGRNFAKNIKTEEERSKLDQ